MRFATIIIYLLLTLPTWAQGIPYFQHFSAQEYKAHNFNFDVISTPDGFTFIANFELANHSYPQFIARYSCLSRPQQYRLGGRI